ncbi:sensor histidine kinase [Candidatus Hydrogenedentota bacterium]
MTLENIHLRGHFLAIFDDIDADLYVSDMSNYEILYMNRRMREACGGVLGKKCWDTIRDDMTGPCPFCTNQRLVDEHGEPAGSVIWEYVDAITNRRFRSIDRAVPWDGGRLAHLSVLLDVTGEDAQEEKARLRQQLIQADKMISLGILVSGVAHEINNPNQFIMSHLSILEKAWKDVSPVLERHYEETGDFVMAGMNYSEARKDIPAMFRSVRKGARRIKEIVQELREYARDNPADALELVNVNRVVKSATLLLSDVLNTSTKSFAINSVQQLPKVKGNYRRLEQVIVNLLRNSCEALSSNEEEVAVSTSFDEHSNKVVIEVADKGKGIPPEALPHIMDPFFTMKREQGGTGLGLSIASGIVMEHGGTLSFVSEVDAGTTAKLELPAHTADR